MVLKMSCLILAIWKKNSVSSPGEVDTVCFLSNEEVVRVKIDVFTDAPSPFEMYCDVVQL